MTLSRAMGWSFLGWVPAGSAWGTTAVGLAKRPRTGRTTTVMERFRLLLPRAIVEEMFRQAVAELPNECCGILAGRVEEGVGRVVRRYPLVNAAASGREYESEPRSMFEAMRAMRKEGTDLLA